jgi:RimJ/RimL family protein N-acetyltransferase
MTRPGSSGALRSTSVLSAEELQDRRSRGLPVAYDPAQAGWIDSSVPDDVDLGRVPVSGTATVSLRAWRMADLLRYTAMLDDPELWDTMTEPYPDPLDPDLAAQLITLSNAGSHHVVRAILAAGLPVGQVRLHYRAGPEGEAELSYWIGRAHRGRGHASAAVAQILREAPARVMARVRDDNEASRRVLTRAGFHRSGVDPARPGWSLFALHRD